MNTTGEFMLTASGREYRLSGAEALISNPPELRDIAHHLAMLNRFTGGTFRPYSVAEHSLLVERIAARCGAAPGLRMALLMHDAHEAYTSDLSSPGKRSVGVAWTGYEAIHSANLRGHFGLRTAFAAYRRQIQHYDLVALATERRDLTAFDPSENTPWAVLDTPGQEVPADPVEHLDPEEPPMTWREMRDAFTHKFLLLRELVRNQVTEAAA